MKNIPLYQVDAFTHKLFGGNPAAICPLDAWLPEETMQQIAAENNLSETAFIVPEGADFAIRWFTPEVEVDLCGHATLATAHVYFSELGYTRNTLILNSKSGPLRVSKQGQGYSMDFPTDLPQRKAILPTLSDSLGQSPIALYKGKSDYLVILETEADVRNCQPNFLQLAKLSARGIIISAQGKEVDFVSRFFGPKVGINEDPVTGSAHTTLTPYWSDTLQKKVLTAKQLSKREGHLTCINNGARTQIIGEAITYMRGSIHYEEG